MSKKCRYCGTTLRSIRTKANGICSYCENNHNKVPNKKKTSEGTGGCGDGVCCFFALIVISLLSGYWEITLIIIAIPIIILINIKVAIGIGNLRRKKKKKKKKRKKK